MSTDQPSQRSGQGSRNDAAAGHALGRRRFLADTGFGLGAMALADLLGQEGLLANPTKPSFEPALRRNS